MRSKLPRRKLRLLNGDSSLDASETESSSSESEPLSPRSLTRCSGRAAAEWLVSPLRAQRLARAAATTSEMLRMTFTYLNR